VALSEEEQRLLDQMEAALAAEDPKLVNAMRGTGLRRLHRRRAAVAGVAFFGGLTLLVLGLAWGVSWGWIVSVVGFCVMVAAAVAGIYAWRHIGGGNSDPGDNVRPSARQPSGSGDAHGFMDKMEERWKRRRDESGF
jgi:hypothetical protein